MRRARAFPAMFACVLAMIASRAAAQQQTERAPEPAAMQIRGALRAFYFSLAHHDWEALTGGILPAKVVAHRPAPAAIVAASQSQVRSMACSPPVAGRVEGAAVTIRDGWAAASVARCGAGEGGDIGFGADQFRFIEFDGRWWIVYIALLDEPGAVQLAR